MSLPDQKAAAAARNRLCLLYGFISALAGAFVTLGLFFGGLQEDVHGLKLSGIIGGLLGLAIYVTVCVLGVRAVRATVAPWDSFTYGTAFWTAFRISLVAMVFGTGFYLLYYTLINPGLRDVMLQQRLEALAAKGLTDDQIEKVTNIQKLTLTPVVVAIFYVVSSTVIGLIVSLVLAAILKRPDKAVTAPQPPPL